MQFPAQAWLKRKNKWHSTSVQINNVSLFVDKPITLYNPYDYALIEDILEEIIITTTFLQSNPDAKDIDITNEILESLP